MCILSVSQIFLRKSNRCMAAEHRGAQPSRGCGRMVNFTFSQPVCELKEECDIPICPARKAFFRQNIRPETTIARVAQVRN